MKKSYFKKDFNKTIIYADYILNIDNKNLDALKYKSDSLRELGDYEGSLECANVIVELEPTPFNLANQSAILWLLNDVEKSFKILDNLLYNSSDYEDAFKNKSYFLFELARYDEVIELCNYVLDKNPNDINALNMKAMVYYELKDYEFAWESIEKAFSLDNDNEWTINKRRDIFDKLNQK